jgi:toxin HigB-1
MIKSFACKDTEELFKDRRVQRFQSFERQARRRLAAPSLNALVSAESGKHVSHFEGQKARAISNQY